MSGANEGYGGQEISSPYDIKWLPRLILLIFMLSVTATSFALFMFYSNIFDTLAYGPARLPLMKHLATWLAINVSAVWILTLGCVILWRSNTDALSQPRSTEHPFRNLQRRRCIQICGQRLTWVVIMLLLTGAPSAYAWHFLHAYGLP